MDEQETTQQFTHKFGLSFAESAEKTWTVVAVPDASDAPPTYFVKEYPDQKFPVKPPLELVPTENSNGVHCFTNGGVILIQERGADGQIEGSVLVGPSCKVYVNNLTMEENGDPRGLELTLVFLRSDVVAPMTSNGLSSSFVARSGDGVHEPKCISTQGALVFVKADSSSPADSPVDSEVIPIATFCSIIGVLKRYTYDASTGTLVDVSIIPPGYRVRQVYEPMNGHQHLLGLPGLERFLAGAKTSADPDPKQPVPELLQAKDLQQLGRLLRYEGS